MRESEMTIELMEIKTHHPATVAAIVLLFFSLLPPCHKDVVAADSGDEGMGSEYDWRMQVGTPSEVAIIINFNKLTCVMIPPLGLAY